MKTQGEKLAGGTGSVRAAFVDLRAVPADEEAVEGRRRPRSRKLSRKEREVLDGLAQGRTTEEIAGLLFVSPHTVRTHVKNGMRKLGARSRAHAVAIALRDGAIEIEREPELARPDEPAEHQEADHRDHRSDRWDGAAQHADDR